MAVKRVNHFVIAEIFRGAVRVNHQVNAVINSQIGFRVHHKIPVVTVQRVGAPDFNRAVIGGSIYELKAVQMRYRFLLKQAELLEKAT